MDAPAYFRFINASDTKYCCKMLSQAQVPIPTHGNTKICYNFLLFCHHYFSLKN